jgi:hypothetical protein
MKVIKEFIQNDFAVSLVERIDGKYMVVQINNDQTSYSSPSVNLGLSLDVFDSALCNFISGVENVQN